jgi:hypothetical protein
VIGSSITSEISGCKKEAEEEEEEDDDDDAESYEIGSWMQLCRRH